MSRHFALVALLVLPLTLAAQTPAAPIKLNQIQVIGTHNSYHAGLSPNEANFWRSKSARLFDALDYTHPPLADQLNAGVRQLEIDIYADTKGGLYAHPAGPVLSAAAGFPADPPFDPNGLMLKPGFKVLHVQDIDYRSACQTLIVCLQQVRIWSLAHPDHIPVFLLIETKQSSLKGVIPNVTLTEPEKFTPATFDALDAEIRSVFPPAELVTPDEVRGGYPTLNAAILAGNWPTLDSARGKVVFIMDQRAVGPVYVEGHPSLQGRVIFTNAVPGTPDAAFTEMNDGSTEAIAELVRKGYLVRARTDADTKEARTNDTTRRDAMFASGAQLLSTDYPANEPAKWPGHFTVSLPGNLISRCDPVNAALPCDSSTLNK